MPAVRITDTTTTDHELSTRRLNVMRLGYAFMGVGLAIVKWPILVQNAASLPVFEGVVACLLTAMSLLAFLGLRYPIRMLPILLFEVLWKVIWIAAVAVPHLIADDINAATGAVLVNCSLVAIIIAVIPWPYVWVRYIRAPADAWRCRSGQARRWHAAVTTVARVRAYRDGKQVNAPRQTVQSRQIRTSELT